LIVALLVSHRSPFDRRPFRLQRTREECRTRRNSSAATLLRLALSLSDVVAGRVLLV
jgi:hypothetical protein